VGGRTDVSAGADGLAASNDLERAWTPTKILADMAVLASRSELAGAAEADLGIRRARGRSSLNG
jgi:hypothetical protein